MSDTTESGGEGPITYPGIQRLAGRFEYTDKRISGLLEFSATEMDERVQWITDCIKGQASDFQKFLAHYFGRGVFWERSAAVQVLVNVGLGRSLQWEKSVNRFALTVGLIARFCPQGGRWFDVGSLGHDAVKVKLERPDIHIDIASYEGCILYLDHAGLHYYNGQPPLPANHVQCRQIDIEKQKLPVEDDSVDLLTSFESLEHYKFAPQHSMLEANRVLKPGGSLVMTTPNGLSAAAISRILHGEHPAENTLYSRVPEYGRVHPLEYSHEQLRDLVKSYGFEIQLLASMNMTPFDRGELGAMSAARAAGSLMHGRHPGEFGEKWLLVARKARRVTEPVYPASLFG